MGFCKGHGRLLWFDLYNIICGAPIWGKVSFFNRFCQEIPNIPLIYTSTANYHKEIIPPINRYLSMKVPSQMIKFWKLSPAIEDTLFKPITIPLKWLRQVAGKALCITGIKWIIGVKIPFTVTVLKNWRKGCLRNFEPYWLSTGVRHEMTGAELEDWYIDFGYADGP